MPGFPVLGKGEPIYFPQFVDGGGYLTTLILLNTSSTPESGRLAIFGDNGALLVVNQLGGTRNSAFSYSIPPGGVFVFETDGFPLNANVGSVQLIPDAGTSSPVGAGVFSFLQGGVRVTESGVPSVSATTHARIGSNWSFRGKRTSCKLLILNGEPWRNRTSNLKNQHMR